MAHIRQIMHFNVYVGDANGVERIVLYEKDMDNRNLDFESQKSAIYVNKTRCVHHF